MAVLREVLRNFTFANQLTFLRLIAIPFFIIAALTNRPQIALALFIGAAVTDSLDGLIARYLKQTTALGAFLDPIADKLMVTAAMIVLTIPDNPKMLPEYEAPNHVPLWLTVLTISRDIFIVTTAIILYFVVRITRFPPSSLGKLTTFSEILTVTVFLVYNARGEMTLFGMAMCWVTLVLVVSSGFHYIYRCGVMIREAQATAPPRRDAARESRRRRRRARVPLRPTILASRTVTPMGRSAALALAPLGRAEDIAAALDETEESARLIEAEGGLPLRGIVPLEEIFALVAREGSVLTGREVLAAARFCEVVDGARGFGRRVQGTFPILGGRAASLPPLGPVGAVMAGKIAPSGELEDAASVALARIRARIQGTTSALHAKLESILSRQDSGKFLSDAFVTQRGGRFVLPVRTDAPTPVRGIVHGGSSSGATIFIEPLATVEMNNDLVRLRDEETAETERILREWTERLRASLPDLRAAAEQTGRLDLAQAKGLLARDLDAVRPSIGEGLPLALAAARHPLLEKTLEDSGGRIVPIDLAFPAGTRTLIVSGPNAGGKTIVLKTAGLLAVMAHAGLFVPAKEASLPLLRQVLVDIGDMQSIEGSLSTFSAHVRSLVEMTRGLVLPSLVLIDEIGTGTDPAEGGVLAIALLEWLRERGATTIATTHHGPVKVYGIETDGVASAAVEFDETTLAPTYRLLGRDRRASSGSPRRRAAGPDAGIVASARSRLTSGEREAEGYPSSCAASSPRSKRTAADPSAPRADARRGPAGPRRSDPERPRARGEVPRGEPRASSRSSGACARASRRARGAARAGPRRSRPDPPRDGDAARG
jgi:CDP-diacylglycerol--glycerol-3-phosphate 3-phosphatidyltransferase